MTSVADSVELVKATGCPSCSRVPPRPVSLASTCNTHGLFTSKNFNVVAFAIKLLAVLKALSYWDDYDHTAFTCVSSVSGFTISARFGVKRDNNCTCLGTAEPLSHLWGHVLNSLDSTWMWGDAITAKEMAHPGNLLHFELKFPGV